MGEINETEKEEYTLVTKMARFVNSYIYSSGLIFFRSDNVSITVVFSKLRKGNVLHSMIALQLLKYQAHTGKRVFLSLKLSCLVSEAKL